MSRRGAYMQHLSHDPRETTKKARETLHERFARAIDAADAADADGAHCPPATREQRIQTAMSAHYRGLAQQRWATHPPVLSDCAWCAQEQRRDRKPGATGRICTRHQEAWMAEAHAELRRRHGGAITRPLAPRQSDTAPRS